MSEFLAIYFPFYFIAVILAIPPVVNKDILDKYNPGYDTLLVLFLAVGCILLFGLRSENMGTDTVNYIKAFNQIQFADGFNEALNTRTAFSSKDPFFNIFTYYIGNWFGLRGYFLVLAIIYVVPILISVFYLSKTNRALMFVCFMGLIAFPNMGVNIVRSAASISCCVLSLSLFINKKWKYSLLFFAFSIAFHFSTIIIFLAGIFVFLPIPFYLYILALFILTVLASKGVGLVDLPVIGEIIAEYDRLSGYLSGDRVIGSLSPFIILFYFGILFYALYFKPKIKDNGYDRIIKMYIVLTGFYFMTFSLNDSYRFGFFPAMLAPILLCYPILNYKIKNNFSFFLLGIFVLITGLLSYYRTT